MKTWKEYNDSDWLVKLEEFESGINENPNDSSFSILLLFYSWILLLEKNASANNDIPFDILQKKIDDNYLKSYNKYSKNDSRYCFVVGWIVNISFWYFTNDEEEGKKMMFHACKLSPDNDFYRLACSQDLELDEIERLKLKNS